jgi:hypothetical protein
VAGELRLLQHCEVLAAPPHEGAVMRWADQLLVRRAVTLPRWHSWGEAQGVVALASAVGTVRVRPSSGPTFTVRGSTGGLGVGLGCGRTRCRLVTPASR